jgi:hypothetical protein
MKQAIARQSHAGVIKAGQTYPFVRMAGENIVIEADGFEIGFSSEFLKLIDSNADRRKELVDERIQLEKQIAGLKERFDSVVKQIADIDNLHVNQIGLEL